MHGQITAKLYLVGVLNFQDTFETRKKSFISAFLVYMTVPLINTSKSAKLKKKNFFFTKSLEIGNRQWKFRHLKVLHGDVSSEYVGVSNL